ncbi:hypothetical protein [Mesorhizobium caraganae]|uniref:hypothetical protein n=1 Tax=Mesorhizobium caraganae TaxID=483206 RepID=UPI0017820018|nr:hypothetical protein [Mesorhizobium caraganae]
MKPLIYRPRRRATANKPFHVETLFGPLAELQLETFEAFAARTARSLASLSPATCALFADNQALVASREYPASTAELRLHGLQSRTPAPIEQRSFPSSEIARGGCWICEPSKQMLQMPPMQRYFISR